MDSVILQKGSQLEPYNKKTETQQPSKLKTIAFAVLIIVGIGGVLGVVLGLIGLASSQAQWLVTVIGKEGCLTLVIGGGVIGGVGIGGGIYGLKRKPSEEQLAQRPQMQEEIRVQPKKENLYQDNFVIREGQPVVVEPKISYDDQISAELPIFHYTYVTNLTIDSYDFYSKNSLGFTSKKQNISFAQVQSAITSLSSDYDFIPQTDLKLDI